MTLTHRATDWGTPVGHDPSGRAAGVSDSSFANMRSCREMKATVSIVLIIIIVPIPGG